MGDPSLQLGAVAVGSANGTRSAGLSFVSGDGAVEEETVTWNIKNVEEFLEMSNEEVVQNGIRFAAGTCALKDGTKAPSTWKFRFNFKHSKKQGKDYVGGFLFHFADLKGSKVKVKSAKATYSVSLSSGGKPIESFTLSRKEFAVLGWGEDKLVTKSTLLQKTKATNTLDVTLQVKVFSTHGFKAVRQETVSTPSDQQLELGAQLIADYEKLLESGDSADILVKVPKEAGGEVDEDSYTKKVHKTVLVARSAVFSRMFAEGGEMVEAKKGEVVIEDMSPKGLDIFLNYLYTGKVLDEWVQVPEQMLNCAEKYGLEKLKLFCGRNLMLAVTPKNALRLTQLAKLLNLPEAVMTALEDFIHKNTKAVVAEGSGTGGQGQRE